MTEPRGRTPRLLFVLSSDYGELANALSLLAGQELEAVLLMPDRLFALNGAGLPVTSYRYSSPADVTEHVRRERPDVVLLFSGYLYAVNHLFVVRAVEALVRELQAAGQRIATSDPFLGLLSDLHPSSLSDHLPRRRLLEVFGRLARLYREVPHVYPVDLTGVVGVPSVSCFNENILVSAADLVAHRLKLAQALGLDPSGRRWLFVLSQEDYGVQSGVWGQSRFEEILIDNLEAASRAGRQPVLIAPAAATAALQGRGSAIDGLVTVPFCGYELFQSLLLDAEYVFYWNVFSHSSVARLVNGFPYFVFDSGHLARAIPPLAELGRKLYYAGSELPYLDPVTRLDAGALALLARRQDVALQAARENFRRSPSPRAMIERLLT